MKCVLMHKKIPAAYLELDSETGYILKIYEVCRPEHLPVGVGFKKGIADRAALNEWWTDRAIPASRSGIHEAMEVLKIHDTKTLLTRCFGLSLSDQYWIKPDKSDVKWEAINFFDNPFSDDIGDVLFGNSNKTNGFDFSSPDNTSDGCLKKRWKIIDGKRCLVKGGSKPFQQQPFNEAIASLICQRLEIPHVDYSVIWSGDEFYSVCEDFVSSETELIGAWRVIQTRKKDNSVSVYRHYVNCCEALGVKNIEKFLDRMIVLDYIIANEDRHLNNFGLLRNAETLEWIGAAPIFDSGTSLGYDSLTVQIANNKTAQCKPFKKSHIDQLKLATSFEWVDFEKLYGIEDDIKEILSSENAEKYIDEERKNAIAQSVANRIEIVHRMAAVMENTIVDDVKNDVEENIAEDYLKEVDAHTLDM